MTACKQNSGAGGSDSARLETEDQKTLYALGLLIGRNVKPFALKPEELAIVKSGLTDSVTAQSLRLNSKPMGRKVKRTGGRRSSVGVDEAKKKGQEFASNVAKQKDATTTASGIVIRSITAGSGQTLMPPMWSRFTTRAS
jgi:FKBP-type peptidyl-prolyl cis-trans isomerase FkpA